MKRTLFATLLGGIIMTTPVWAEDIKLPNPIKTGGKPLMEVIMERRSTRAFSDRMLDEQTLSDILFAAYGISHDGKRTIPTSMNRQNMNIYVALPQGTFRYQAEDNTLIQISQTDIRQYFNNQDYMATVPVILIYTGSDPENSPLHAGSAYQNVGLYTASTGLNNVVRMPRDKSLIAQALDLPAEEVVIVSQAIGYPPED